MSAAGSYSRVPLGEAVDVMCVELEDILNRVCGIEEVALAYAWMNKHSMKVPDREALAKGAGDGCHAGAAPFANAGGLGDGVAVGQAAVSSSAPTKGELERAALSPSLVGEPPSPTGTDSPEAVELAGRSHNGGSPTRHLAAVPTHCTRCGSTPDSFGYCQCAESVALSREAR